ncbi:MAG: transcriptional regulator, partial [Firmicutes bacterium]|nr:transcriptional regulator [Bacillota bacterium]
GVTIRTIQKDIQFLSPKFPIYTKQGGNGGIFIGEDYKPYINTLSQVELDTLCAMLVLAEGTQKKVLSGILLKYGPDKLVV